MIKKFILILGIILFIFLILISGKILNKNKDEENLVDDSKIENNQKSNTSDFEKINEVKSNEILELTNENFQKEVIESEKTVLIYCYTNWCNVCKKLYPIIKVFANENSNIKVLKVNIDKQKDVAKNFGVRYIPTLLVIKEGKEVNRNIGLITKEEIKEMTD